MLGTAVPEPEADFDNDGDVDGYDFLIWQRGGTIPPLGTAELVLWQTKYGSNMPLTASAHAVPEPTTWILIALAVAGGNLTRRR